MNIPKTGSKWVSIDGKTFHVVETIWTDDHTWVHYKSEHSGVAYSCYLESFREKFQETVA
jgi:hypothetical protein